MWPVSEWPESSYTNLVWPATKHYVTFINWKSAYMPQLMHYHCLWAIIHAGVCCYQAWISGRPELALNVIGKSKFRNIDKWHRFQLLIVKKICVGSFRSGISLEPFLVLICDLSHDCNCLNLYFGSLFKKEKLHFTRYVCIYKSMHKIVDSALCQKHCCTL